MPECTKCGNQIDHLISTQTKMTGFTVEDSKPCYGEDLLDPFYYGVEEPQESYYCPICGDVLFHSEGEAVHFFVHNEEEES